MCKLLACANQYAKQSTWVDFALVKGCLGAFGLLVGMFLPRTRRKQAAVCAAIVFAVTYLLLICRLLKAVFPVPSND